MRNFLKDISTFPKPYKLELGSGGFGREKWDEWIHCDCHIPKEDHHIEVECFAWDLPFENNSVGHIYLRGVFEHMRYAECHNAINEWDRVLIQNGIIEFNYPPIDDYIRRYVKGEVDINWMMGALYGWQKFDSDTHMSGWTQDKIKEFLKEWEDRYNIELFPGYHGTIGNIVRVESFESWDAGVHGWVRMIKK